MAPAALAVTLQLSFWHIHRTIGPEPECHSCYGYVKCLGSKCNCTARRAIATKRTQSIGGNLRKQYQSGSSETKLLNGDFRRQCQRILILRTEKPPKKETTLSHGFSLHAYPIFAASDAVIRQNPPFQHAEPAPFLENTRASHDASGVY